MAVPFRSLEEINDRMHDSVCLLNGEPVYVIGQPQSDAFGVLKPGYAKLPFSADIPFKPQYLRVTDHGWSTKDFNIGYLNDERDKPTALYLARIPVRGLGYKAGLTASNIDGLDRYLPFAKALAKPAFRAMLMNVYPTYLKALGKLGAADGGTVAFDKQLAVEYTGDVYHLHYRGRKVATSLNGEAYKLSKAFVYLKEMLAEKRVRIIE